MHIDQTYHTEIKFNCAIYTAESVTQNIPYTGSRHSEEIITYKMYITYYRKKYYSKILNSRTHNGDPCYIQFYLCHFFVHYSVLAAFR